ncbi:MAG TPA: hypothetical protein PK087_01230, partial [Bacilli bacterium]|nr:hypothetical protein [Bacilli bacterium]
KILNIIKSNATEPFKILWSVFEELSLLTSNPDMSFSKASKYFYTTFTSYEKYFKKLALIASFHKGVTKKVPLFTIKTRLSNLYVKETEYLNEALLDLYMECRDNKHDEYTYACMRYIFAPFWSSYLINSSDITQRKPGFLETLKNYAISQLTNWEKVFDKNVDDFIFENNLAIKYESNIVESIFSISCPTLNECLKEVNENTSRENVEMIKDIITQLKETFAYEEIIYKEWYDINALSYEFLNLFYHSCCENKRQMRIIIIFALSKSLC